MKLKNLIDGRFKIALLKLVSSELSMKTSFKIADILEEVNHELSKYDRVRKEALKKYAKTKEDGSFEVGDDGQVVFKSEEDSKQFFKEHADLVEEDIKITKIQRSELIKEDVKIRPEEIAAIKEILE